MSFIYLASPYSHYDFNVRHERYVQVMEAVLEISRHGVSVYSPIVHWHNIAVEKSLPTDAEFWRTQNEPLIKASDELWVLCVEGWRQSKGIEMEKGYATYLGKRYRHLTFASLGETCSIYKTLSSVQRTAAVSEVLKEVEALDSKPGAV